MDPQTKHTLILGAVLARVQALVAYLLQRKLRRELASRHRRLQSKWTDWLNERQKKREAELDLFRSELHTRREQDLECLKHDLQRDADHELELLRAKLSETQAIQEAALQSRSDAYQRLFQFGLDAFREFSDVLGRLPDRFTAWYLATSRDEERGPEERLDAELVELRRIGALLPPDLDDVAGDVIFKLSGMMVGDFDRDSETFHHDFHAVIGPVEEASDRFSERGREWKRTHWLLPKTEPARPQRGS